ncbi:MAG TPA: hypothetical protein V6C72_10060 [Chroococcales cyanobacterium]
MATLTGIIAAAATARMNVSQARYTNDLQKGDRYLKAGDYKNAIASYRRAAENPQTGKANQLEDRLFRLLTKIPTRPEGHVLLAEYYLNRLSHEKAASPYWAIAAQRELKSAISFSPNQKNSEAEGLLAALRKRVHSFDAPIAGEYSDHNSLCEQAVLSNWTPPEGNQFRCVRIRTFRSAPDQKRLASAEVMVESGSKEFDAAALAAVESAMNDYPLLSWHPWHFVFTAEHGSRYLDFVPTGTIVQLIPRLKENDSSTARAMVSNYFKTEWPPERVRELIKAVPEVEYKRDWSDYYRDQEREFVSFGDRACVMKDGRSLCYMVGPVVVDCAEVDESTNLADYAVKQLTHECLEAAVVRYQILHASIVGIEEWRARRLSTDRLKEELVHCGSYDKYSCRLEDGRTVTARLELSHVINKISVDDSPDQMWMEAFREMQTSPERLYSPSYLQSPEVPVRNTSGQKRES